MKRHNNKVLVIIGPTASGKTALALEIAKRFNGEVVSADSRQIYKGMDIGTAKPLQNQKSRRRRGSPLAAKIKNQNYEAKFKNIKSGYWVDGIKHHLIDIKNLDQDYSVGQYKKDALAAIRKILKAGKLPVIVGGTGLYVSAIVNNLEFPEVKENKKLRAKLEKEIKTKELNHVFKKLVELDPEAAYIVDPNNSRRVIRALEVAILTGKPFTEQRKSGPPLFEFLQIGLKLQPEILRKRIEKRTSRMFKDGLVKEVKKLLKKFDFKPKAFDAIGYREIIEHLRGNLTVKEAEELINKNTWRYAKRQMGWFIKDKKIKWLNPTEKLTKQKILRLVSGFISIN